jgi:cbb3-type cytochrome oxidase subunit 1
MSIPSLFFRTAVLLAILGIALGIFMGVNQDFRLAHMHAHLNLLGWVSFFIFGGYYALAPQAAEGMLPKLHYVLCLTGLIAFMAGLTSVALAPEPLVILAVVGSLLVLAGFLVFAVIVFRTRIGSRKSENGSRRGEYPVASKL